MAKNSTADRRRPWHPGDPHPDLGMTAAELKAACERGRLLFSLREDGSIVPGPGLTHFDVLAFEMQFHESVGRESERKRQAARKVISPAIDKVRERAAPRRAEMARRLRRGQPIKQIANEMRASRNTVAAVKRGMR